MLLNQDTHVLNHLKKKLKVETKHVLIGINHQKCLILQYDIKVYVY